VLTKIQLPIGQHLLEFLYTEDPELKIEKEVDFPEAGKSYLVIIKGLNDLVEAAAKEVKRKAEEEARIKAEKEAKRRAEAEAKRKAEEEAEAKAKRKAEIKKIIGLAEDYYYGCNGKSKDYKKAAANYLIAAKAGDAYSQYGLGLCYEKGQGVEQSAQEAVKWYSKAAAQGEDKAKERLEILKAEAEAKRKAEKEKERKRKSGAINGHDYVDLGLPSGLKWATCNVGASSREEYGNYYAWGEISTKSEYTSKNSKTVDKRINDISGNSTYDVARAKWGSSWRMPTYDELHELVRECKWHKISQEGMVGYMGIGPNGNNIFLPAAGYRSDEIMLEGHSGYYWGSRPEKSTYNIDGRSVSCDDQAYHLQLYYNYYSVCFCYEIKGNFRQYGYSVRPVSK
jgi:TPR repeat protein